MHFGKKNCEVRKLKQIFLAAIKKELNQKKVRENSGRMSGEKTFSLQPLRIEVKSFGIVAVSKDFRLH